MAHILIMPRQGNTVESCIITAWKIKEGDKVSADTIVCEVETDKASFEVPAGESGTVLKIMCSEGDDVPVLSAIAAIGAEGENWRDFIPKNNTEEHSVKDTQPTKEEKTPHIPRSALHTAHCALHISPRAENLARRESADIKTIYGTGPEGRIIERDVKLALENRPPLTAAAKAALSCDIPETGSGFAGRITEEDINTPRTAHNAPDSAQIKGIRKIIADRMLKSLSETAQFTLNAHCSVLKLQEIRAKNEYKKFKITINDLILFAVSRTLPQFLYMNAHKTGDTIKTFGQIHLGAAVDTPRGLMVPVIRNADKLTIFEISAEMKRLSSACQNSSVKPDELTGSTFSVSNLGSLGITSFTPVLNIPEVAILGVCSIEMKPVSLNNGEFGFEPFIGFSLTINHQAVDGAPAARFLKTLCETTADIDSHLSNQEC